MYSHRILPTVGAVLIGSLVLVGGSVPVASAAPVVLGCAPQEVSESVGFDDRSPGWINRYQGVAGVCQVKDVGPWFGVGVEEPVEFDFDHTTQLQRDVLQDVVNHLNIPGLEYEVSLSYDRSPRVFTFSRHVFPGGSVNRNAEQQRFAAKAAFEQYMRSLGAETYDVNNGSAPRKAVAADVYPAPGYKVNVQLEYENNNTSTPGSPGKRTITVHVVSEYTGGSGLSVPEGTTNSVRIPQSPIVSQ